MGQAGGLLSSIVPIGLTGSLRRTTQRKRIGMSRQLLDIGDIDAASEEMMFAASHVARAVLLKHGQFPLSRMELPSQLEAISADLAQLLDRLVDGDLDSEELRSGEILLRREIAQL